jgi:hypothetical protein
MSEAELFYRLSDDRLRRRALWAGGALLASALLPYEVIDNQPQFLWQLFGDLPPAAVVAALSKPLAGAAALVARKACKRAGSLALAVIAALAGAPLCEKLGADASAWGILPVPPSFLERQGLALFAMALTAAGGGLVHREATQRVGRGYLLAAVGVALLFYAWPGRGESPGTLVGRQLAAIFAMPNGALVLGMATIATVSLWPALVALAGAVRAWRPPPRAPIGLVLAAMGGYPLILTMTLFFWFLRSDPGSAIFAGLGVAVQLGALLALGAAALETLGEAVLTADPDRPEPGGWPPKRAAATAGIGLGLLLLVQGWLALPPEKGASFEIGAASQPGDLLYGVLVERWSAARWAWDATVREKSDATGLLEVKGQAKAMVEAAEKIDPALAAALDELARASTRLDTTSRDWARLVADVNAAAQAAKLPYYLDARVSLLKTKDGIRRLLVVDSYRVSHLRRFDMDGDAYATLHVRPMGRLRGEGHATGLLGFSRDQQPFALVLLDENDVLLRELESMRTSVPPSCGQSLDPARALPLLHCGEKLAAMLADPELAKRAAVASVERHELQHQIDGPLLTMAGPVLRKMAGYADEQQERINRELSAYVAQLTSSEPPVLLGLVVPLRFALLDDGGTYHHAAVLLFEALGRGRKPYDGRRVEPAVVGEIWDELAALDDAALRAHAAEAWEDLFGDELEEVALVEEASAPEPTDGAVR